MSESPKTPNRSDFGSSLGSDKAAMALKERGSLRVQVSTKEPEEWLDNSSVASSAPYGPTLEASESMTNLQSQKKKC